ncbi:MAG TPA: glycosidase [Verrucomicrobia bacterium]|nr:MAG: glycosidase [Lentisphaerae bacterium GWF2_57_35]HBA84184.1 glycosidase [Verrucomicrobiota bacterium]
MKNNQIKRMNLVLRPDHTRVLLRPFLRINGLRTCRICADVMALSESKVHALWAQVQSEFGNRHVKIDEVLLRRFEEVRPCVGADRELSRERKLLLGAYFSHEYSLEAAALFNPSMVPHPDQSHLPRGALRFILSLRATGEGHISSITFRAGILDAKNHIKLTPATQYCFEPAQAPNAFYEKGLFDRKLQELGLEGAFSRRALHDLPEAFTLEELRGSVDRASQQLWARKQETADVARKVILLAQSNYEVQFAPDSNLSERVLFPTSPSQSNGIEDARFVLFQDEDGAGTYYATYTAYDGRTILPQFIETPDFLHFKFITLNGAAVQNKGLALFPRKIQGRYAMLGRQDYENIYVMFSDHLHFWHTMQFTLKPKFPWEFIQMGNCGSPIETEAGWLVLSHGVGAMRKYCISAFLLDRDDPTQVIGRLREPLIKPNANEREGYVPNVVYSCGSLLHGRQLVIPYAMADSAATFAAMPLDDVLAAME